MPPSVERFVQFYRATADELRMIARLTGRSSVHALDLSDVFTTSYDIAQFTDIAHA